MLLGADVLIDENLNVWLLEVNKYCFFGYTLFDRPHKVYMEVMPKVITEDLNMVLYLKE